MIMRYFFKFRFLIIGVFVFSSIAIVRFFIFSPTVCLRGRCLKVELATTEKQRSRGLMDRTFLPETRGMLFVVPGDDFWSFWMKNTLIPLDIIWMDRDHKIIHSNLICATPLELSLSQISEFFLQYSPAFEVCLLR